MPVFIKSSGIDYPLEPTSGSQQGSVSEEQISMLCEMGFTPAQAKKALRETVSRSVVSIKRAMYLKLYLKSG